MSRSESLSCATRRTFQSEFYRISDPALPPDVRPGSSLCPKAVPTFSSALSEFESGMRRVSSSIHITRDRRCTVPNRRQAEFLNFLAKSGYLRRRVRRAGSRRLIDGFQAHGTHQAPHTMGTTSLQRLCRQDNFPSGDTPKAVLDWNVTSNNPFEYLVEKFPVPPLLV